MFVNVIKCGCRKKWLLSWEFFLLLLICYGERLFMVILVEIVFNFDLDLVLFSRASLKPMTLK